MMLLPILLCISCVAASDALGPCSCATTWSSEEDGCFEVESGCPDAACDSHITGDDASWCMIEDVPCATNEGGWSYCDENTPVVGVDNIDHCSDDLVQLAQDSQGDVTSCVEYLCHDDSYFPTAPEGWYDNVCKLTCKLCEVFEVDKCYTEENDDGTSYSWMGVCTAYGTPSRIIYDDENCEGNVLEYEDRFNHECASANNRVYCAEDSQSMTVYADDSCDEDDSQRQEYEYDQCHTEIDEPGFESWTVVCDDGDQIERTLYVSPDCSGEGLEEPMIYQHLACGGDSRLICTEDRLITYSDPTCPKQEEICDVCRGSEPNPDGILGHVCMDSDMNYLGADYDHQQHIPHEFECGTENYWIPRSCSDAYYEDFIDKHQGPECLAIIGLFMHKECCIRPEYSCDFCNGNLPHYKKEVAGACIDGNFNYIGQEEVDTDNYMNEEMCHEEGLFWHKMECNSAHLFHSTFTDVGEDMCSNVNMWADYYDCCHPGETEVFDVGVCYGQMMGDVEVWWKGDCTDGMPNREMYDTATCEGSPYEHLFYYNNECASPDRRVYCSADSQSSIVYPSDSCPQDGQPMREEYVYYECHDDDDDSDKFWNFYCTDEGEIYRTMYESPDCTGEAFVDPQTYHHLGCGGESRLICAGDRLIVYYDPTCFEKHDDDDYVHVLDDSKCGSLMNDDDNDCCAPYGQPMFCHDGFIPVRTGKPCDDDPMGMFSCIFLPTDDGRCGSETDPYDNDCCAPHGETPFCHDGFVPMVSGYECSGDYNGMFTCVDPTFFDDGKCGSMYNDQDTDCCAPHGEEMFCHDGFIPIRNGHMCGSYINGEQWQDDPNGMFTCIRPPYYGGNECSYECFETHCSHECDYEGCNDGDHFECSNGPKCYKGWPAEECIGEEDGHTFDDGSWCMSGNRDYECPPRPHEEECETVGSANDWCIPGVDHEGLVCNNDNQENEMRCYYDSNNDFICGKCDGMDTYTSCDICSGGSPKPEEILGHVCLDANDQSQGADFDPDDHMTESDCGDNVWFAWGCSDAYDHYSNNYPANECVNFQGLFAARNCCDYPAYDSDCDQVVEGYVIAPHIYGCVLGVAIDTVEECEAAFGGTCGVIVEDWDGPSGCHIQNCHSCQFNVRQHFTAAEGHYPICKLYDDGFYDINSDGKVDIRDVVHLINVLLGRNPMDDDDFRRGL